MPRQKVQRSTFMAASRYTKTALIAVFILAICGYFGHQFSSIVTPPELVLISPLDGLTTEDATVMIAGSIEEEGSVTINGAEVLLNKSGDFETEVALERGLNIIEIKGKKRYSRSSSQFIKVVLEREEDRALGRN